MALCAFMLCPLGSAWAQPDPPSRVARLNYFDGPVTFAATGSDNWVYAVRNRPLVSGDQIWVDTGGRSELHIGSTALQLGPRTSLSFSDINDQITQLSLTQGVLNIHLRALAPGQVVEVDTPNLAFKLQQPGTYRIDVNPDRQSTAITVRAGDGVAYGDSGASLSIGPRQQAVFYGTSVSDPSVGDSPPYDSFDDWVRQREQREDRSVSARHVSREMIGYEELDDHGDWRDDTRYGAIWVPRTTVSNWAPYQFGHWAWIAPWGWNWIDDADWGFAPGHYGRWVHLDSSWAWVPGPRHVQPVYAPALVAFVGGSGSRSSWGVSLSGGSPGVAWFPLAPGESYRPAYHVSPTYVRNINQTVIVNNRITNNITNNITTTVYVNQRVPHAIAAVSAAAFVRGQSVHPALRPVDAKQLSKAHIMSAPALAPVRESFIGAAKPAPAYRPPVQLAHRPVIATRAAAPPPALNDTLARQFNAKNGAAAGAGAPLVRQLAAGSAARSGRPAHVISASPAARAAPLPSNQHPATALPSGEKAGSSVEHRVPEQPAHAGAARPNSAPANDIRSDRTPNRAEIPHPPGARISGRPQQAEPAAHPVIVAPHPAQAVGSDQHAARPNQTPANDAKPDRTPNRAEIPHPSGEREFGPRQQAEPQVPVAQHPAQAEGVLHRPAPAGAAQEDTSRSHRKAPHALPAAPSVPRPVEPNVKQQQQQQKEQQQQQQKEQQQQQQHQQQQQQKEQQQRQQQQAAREVPREVPRPSAIHPGPAHEVPLQRAPGIGPQAEHPNEQHRKNVPQKKKSPNE